MADPLPADPKLRIEELEARLERAQTLLDVARTVATSRDVGEALASLLEILVDRVGADRGTIFLNEPATGELYSRVLIGGYRREIRILNNRGIAGHVFTAGEPLVVDDAYSHPAFDRSVDEKSGYRTTSVLAVPIQTESDEVIGVAQLLNKPGGFTERDLDLVRELTRQSAVTLSSRQAIEQMTRKREQEMEFLDVVADITAEIHLTSLLNKVMAEAVKLLKADRGTLFLNEEKSGELYTEVGQGLNKAVIRFPNHLGIAGTVFTSGKSVNIPYAYADLRFNPSFDKKTGYFTRSILCVPVVNKQGKCIGVTQMLNKQGGAFTLEDETRLKAFTAQISIALENAKLFDDVQAIKNYNEAILQSMTNGVVTFDDEGTCSTCNSSAARILERPADALMGRPIHEVLSDDWLAPRIAAMTDTGLPDEIVDADLTMPSGETKSVNATLLPLLSAKGEKLGGVVMIEDISSEKRLKSTMSRYMDPDVAAQLLADGEDVLGGRTVKATVLFSDIRRFTTITEALGAQGTVKLLNDYFTRMMDCIQAEGGMLDKFIGDAIMAGFGIPIAHDDDEDRALRCAIAMLRSLREWNAERAERGEPEVEIGIGLATGDVVAGNIGSPRRMDYTMIGDAVNLGARIESACKAYSAKLLISDATRARLKGTYKLREIDHVVVKGKTQPVAIHEVLDHHTPASFPNVMDAAAHFEAARGKYRARRWDDAIESFRRVLEFNPDDRLSRTYIERCEAMKRDDPGEGWDGVFVMKSK